MDKGPQETRRSSCRAGDPRRPPKHSEWSCTRRRALGSSSRAPARPPGLAPAGQSTSSPERGGTTPAPRPPSSSRTFPPDSPSVPSRVPSPRSPGCSVPTDPPATHRAPLTRGLCLWRGARRGPGRAASSPWARADGRAPRAPGVLRVVSAVPSGSDASRTPRTCPLSPCERTDVGSGQAGVVAPATQRGLPGRPGGTGKSRPPPTSLVRHRGSRAGAPRAPPPARRPRPAPRPFRAPRGAGYLRPKRNPRLSPATLDRLVRPNLRPSTPARAPQPPGWSGVTQGWGRFGG